MMYTHILHTVYIVHMYISIHTAYTEGPGAHHRDPTPQEQARRHGRRGARSYLIPSLLLLLLLLLS